MTTFFADTGAILKRYIPEAGSTWVNSWHADSADAVIISELTTVEAVSVLSRRQRERQISAQALQLLHNDFMVHVETDYVVVNVDSVVLSQARALAGRYPLRARAAVQLACALDVKSALSEQLTVVSVDQELLDAAAAEGMDTEDPRRHS